MNNIAIYRKVCDLKERLENNPDQSLDKITQAMNLIQKINVILDVKERRKR